MDILEREGIFVMGLLFSLVILVVSVGIGAWSRRLIKNIGDYYVAGRSIGALNNGLAMLSLAISLTTFLGLAALIIEGFYVAVAVYAGFTAAFAALMILAGPFLRRHRSFTTMAFISQRYYSRNLRLLSVIIMLVVSMLYLGGNLKGLGIIFYYLLGLPEVLGILVGGLVVTLYVVMGGMFGVTYNQTFQAIVLIFCLIFPTAVILQQLGAGGWVFPPLGYGELVPAMQEMVPHYFWPMVAHPVTYLAIALTAFLGIIGLPHFVMRFFTVKDAREARWSGVVATFLVGLVNTTVYATGFAAVYYLQRENISLPEAKYDYVYFILTEGVVGEEWLAVAIAGAVAAALSTVAGLLMIMGAGLIHDLYGAIKTEVDDRRKLRLSYWAMLVLGIGVTIFSLEPPEFILEAIMWAFSIAGASLGAPLVLGIWWKRTTKEGAGAGMLGGFITTFVPCIFILIMGMEPTEAPLPFIAPYLYGPLGWIKLLALTIPLSFILTIVVSWFTKEPPHQVKATVDDMHGWKDYQEERYRGNVLPIAVIILAVLIMASVFTMYETFAGVY